MSNLISTTTDEIAFKLGKFDMLAFYFKYLRGK